MYDSSKHGDLSDARIKQQTKTWQKSGCVATEEQMDFVAGVIEYVEILERVQSKSSEALPAPPSLPLYGPMFMPPTISERQFRGRIISNNSFVSLIEPAPLIRPVVFLGMNLCRSPHEGYTWRVSRKGWKPFHQVYGVMNNIRTISPQYICDLHKAVSPTTDSY